MVQLGLELGFFSLIFVFSFSFSSKQEFGVFVKISQEQILIFDILKFVKFATGTDSDTLLF